MNKIALHSLRVNNKSLAAEARIIRKEILSAKNDEVVNSLHHHRMTKLKPEARLANLSIAFVKGRRYSEVEPHTTTEPDPRRLHNKLSRFVMDVSREEVDNWLKT